MPCLSFLFFSPNTFKKEVFCSFPSATWCSLPVCQVTPALCRKTSSTRAECSYLTTGSASTPRCLAKTQRYRKVGHGVLLVCVAGSIELRHLCWTQDGTQALVQQIECVFWWCARAECYRSFVVNSDAPTAAGLIWREMLAWIIKGKLSAESTDDKTHHFFLSEHIL